MYVMENDAGKVNLKWWSDTGLQWERVEYPGCPDHYGVELNAAGACDCGCGLDSARLVSVLTILQFRCHHVGTTTYEIKATLCWRIPRLIKASID